MVVLVVVGMGVGVRMSILLDKLLEEVGWWVYDVSSS